jgi:hypothetical protein
MSSYTLPALQATPNPFRVSASNVMHRPMRVHWSLQTAAREALLELVNARRVALCQTRKLGCEADPELFFDDADVAQREAQRICWDCPVRRSCLQVALQIEAEAQTSNGMYSNGTVGGVTAAVRERLVRARRARRADGGDGRRVPATSRAGDVSVPRAQAATGASMDASPRTTRQIEPRATSRPTSLMKDPHARQSA